MTAAAPSAPGRDRAWAGDGRRCRDGAPRVRAAGRPKGPAGGGDRNPGSRPRRPASGRWCPSMGPRWARTGASTGTGSAWPAAITALLGPVGDGVEGQGPQSVGRSGSATSARRRARPCARRERGRHLGSVPTRTWSRTPRSPASARGRWTVPRPAALAPRGRPGHQRGPARAALAQERQDLATPERPGGGLAWGRCAAAPKPSCRSGHRRRRGQGHRARHGRPGRLAPSRAGEGP